MNGDDAAADPAISYQANELLTVRRLCAEYGLGKTMVYEALALGRLRAKVLGKRGTRLRRRDVEKWIEELPDYVPQAPVR
jgi:excisionase family DNA binding protein